MKYVQKRNRRRQPIWLPAAVLALLLTVCGVGIWKYLDSHAVPGEKSDVPDWVTQELLTVNDWSRPGTPLEEINGIVIHYVGNPGTSAQANRNYFESLSAGTDGVYASAHFIVGLEGEILECIPLSEIAYASNTRNDDTIAIEVCHDDETGRFSPVTEASVVKLTAWLCTEFDLKPEQVIRHYDVTGKICPKYYVDHEDAWQDFLDQVDARIQEGFED